METKISTVRLVLEIHCAVGTPVDQVGHASIWIAPAKQYVGPPRDTLEQEGMIRVYGPMPMQKAEAFREKLSALLSDARCEVIFEVAADD